MKQNKFWKVGFIVLFAALLIVVGFFAYSYGENRSSSKGGITTPGMPNPASVYCEQQGGKVQIETAPDGSQSGLCVFNDGTSCDEWAFYRNECQKGQSKAAAKSDSDLIKEAMLRKINSDETKMQVTISKIDGNYAKGGVSPIDGAGGAWFIAAKVSENWVIVYDGQAYPYCSQIAPYNFPKTMVPQCWDAKGAVVTR